MKKQMQICVAVEEVFINIANYAYTPITGNVLIEMSCENDTAEITFTDNGVPYDPLAKEDPDISLPAEERPIGGLGMNKVTAIAQEIGVQPVLSFGNSTGDASMAEYVTSNNKYKSLALMLCCDDTERENGNVEKAEKMVSLCEDFDWVPISMKNDWTTIYGEGVTKK